MRGEAGGELSITSATIDSHYSELLISTTGATDTATGIKMNAKNVVLTDSHVKTETTGAGKAGDIIINAEQLTLTSTSTEEEGASVLSSESKVFDELPDVGDGPDIPDFPDDDDPDDPDDPDEPDDEPGPTPPPAIPGYDHHGNLPINTSTVNDEIGNSGEIVLQVSGQLTLSNNAQINNVTQGSAQGGSINVSAGSLHIDSANLASDVSISTLTTGSGQAGDVNIAVENDILMRGNGQINAMTLGDGDAGNINISATNLSMLETEQNPHVTQFVGIQSLSGQETDIDNAPTGSSGDINLNISGDLQMLHGANIVSITVGDGTAGDININANNILLDSHRGRASNTIGSNTLGPDANGDAGNIQLHVQDTLTLSGNAFVSTTAISQGNAGDMTISARRLLMQGNGDEMSRSGINSSSVGPGAFGNAGTVRVNVSEDILMINGANITSDTANNGNAGNIYITANSLYMEADDDSADTGISSSASAEHPVTGNAADIFINVNEAFEMYGEAELKTESESRGNAGNINITAGSFTMVGSELESKAEAEAEDGEIRFRAGDAGNVNIIVSGHFEMADQAAIASDSIRGGAAGNVSISAGSLTLSEYSSITSTAGLTRHNAGNISIHTAGDINILTGRQYRL